ncbi:MAG: XRE family transcriptional regulator [Synergistales bacterium]|nr:XRE family transcriptional regulator [Synergistales bacterium]
METLKILRTQAGFTQSQLAEKVGLSLNTILNFEKGRREPRSSDLQKIAVVLGCEISELLNPLPSPASKRGKGKKSAA